MSSDDPISRLFDLVFAIVQSPVLLILLALILVRLTISMVLMWTVKRVPPPYRTCTPGQAWLLLIPLFTAFWAYRYLPRVSSSLRAYFTEQGRDDVGDCGRSTGMSVARLGAWSYIIGPIVFFWLIMMLLYLIKVSRLARQIDDDADLEAYRSPSQ